MAIHRKKVKAQLAAAAVAAAGEEDVEADEDQLPPLDPRDWIVHAMPAAELMLFTMQRHSRMHSQVREDKSGAVPCRQDGIARWSLLPGVGQRPAMFRFITADQLLDADVLGALLPPGVHERRPSWRCSSWF